MSFLYMQITKFIGMLATGARGTLLPCLPFLFKLCWPFHHPLDKPGAAICTFSVCMKIRASDSCSLSVSAASATCPSASTLQVASMSFL